MRKVHIFLLHFGTDKVAHFVKTYFVVNNLDRIIWDVVASCDICIASKYYTRPTVGDQYYDLPQDTGLVTSIDLFGPLPRSNQGNKYILVLTDFFSKHTALYPLRNQKVTAIIDAIENHYIPRRGYVPQALLTDRGGQFITLKWKQFAARVGTQLKKTSPCNPQANPVERVMRKLGRVLRTYVRDDHQSLDQIVPRLETIINHVAHSSTGFPPVALEFDYRWYSLSRGLRVNPEDKFRLPPKLLLQHMRPFCRRVAPDPKTPQSRELSRRKSRDQLQQSEEELRGRSKRISQVMLAGLMLEIWSGERHISEATLFIAKLKLFPIYEGPLRVISCPHPNAYELQWLDGRYAGVINLRQLRPDRESQLQPRQPATPDTQRQSLTQSSVTSSEEQVMATLTHQLEDNTTSLDEEYRPWGELQKSQTHLNPTDYQQTAGEKNLPAIAEPQIEFPEIKTKMRTSHFNWNHKIFVSFMTFQSW